MAKRPTRTKGQYLQPSVPAWLKNQPQTLGAVPQYTIGGTPQFTIGGVQVARPPANKPPVSNPNGYTGYGPPMPNYNVPVPRTVQVRTGQNTSQTIPWLTGMQTGTFFSGGSPLAPAGPYNDMRGRGTNRNNGFVVTPPYVPQVPFVPPVSDGGGGGGGYVTGWRRGGGGGGGGYNNTPSWLMNLYNWKI